jgi:cation transport regulator ChaB
MDAPARKGDAMPKSTRTGRARREELPGTLRRSPPKAQETFAKVHDAAAEQYGEGRRAHQTAYAAVKHSFEKVGDHWEPKEHRGPSDEQAAKGGAASSRTYPTAEGVDANASKRHLQELARRLDIRGRSTMDKDELVDAIKKENRRRTQAARR